MSVEKALVKVRMLVDAQKEAAIRRAEKFAVRKLDAYVSIVTALANGPKTTSELNDAVKDVSYNMLYPYLKNLQWQHIIAHNKQIGERFGKWSLVE